MLNFKTFGRRINNGWITADKEDKDFEDILEYLLEYYHHSGGGPDAETIVNMNKREMKEDGCWSFYSTHAPIAGMIRRCPQGILKLKYNKLGAELLMSNSVARHPELSAKVKK